MHAVYTFVLPHFLTLHAALKYLAMEYTTGLLSTLICLASSLSLSGFKQSNIFIYMMNIACVQVLSFSGYIFLWCWETVRNSSVSCFRFSQLERHIGRQLARVNSSATSILRKHLRIHTLWKRDRTHTVLASDRIDRLASSKHQSLSFVLPSLQRCCFYWNGLASARGNLSVILYTLRTTYTQRPWQKRLRSTAKLVGVSVFFGVVQSQDPKFTMPLYVFEAVPLEAILSAGIQNNLLVLDDVGKWRSWGS